MAQVQQLRVGLRLRWFVWPAFYGVRVLARLGLINDPAKAIDCILKHAIKVKVL